MKGFGKFVIKEFQPHEIDNSLVEKLREVATKGFGKHVPFREVADITQKSDKTFVAFYQDSPAAFASSKLINDQLGYLSAAVVDSDFQRQGLYKELTRRRLDCLSGKANYVSTKTQNSVVYSVFKKMLNDVYPNERKPREEILQLARLVDRRVDGELMVVESYGRKLSTFDFNACEEGARSIFKRLNLERGDAYILVGLF